MIIIIISSSSSISRSSSSSVTESLQWHHNERNGVSNHQPHDCFLFIQAQIKENIKAPRHWPLWGEFTGDRSPHKGQWREKCFHLMTSSWFDQNLRLRHNSCFMWRRMSIDIFYSIRLNLQSSIKLRTDAVITAFSTICFQMYIFFVK